MLIFLDMDGVIADFNAHSMKLCGLSDDQIQWHYNNWRERDHDTAKQIGVSNTQFWSMVNKDRSFWETIPVYDYAHELVSALRKMGKVIICTAPNSDPECLAGKSKWLINNKFKFGGDVVITKYKYLLAGPDRVLIDDSDEKIIDFVEYGGKGVLFPQPWNSGYVDSDKNRVQYVLEKLGE